MKKHKILVVDDYSKEFFGELARYGEVMEAVDIDDSIRLGDVTIMVVRSKTGLTKNLLIGCGI